LDALVPRKTEPKSRTIRFPGAKQRHKRSPSQLILDFGDDDEVATLRLSDARDTLEQCFELGCTAEDEGRLVDAASAYRRGLEVGGPEAVLSFNLGNVLFALGKPTEAVESFREAVAERPTYCDAWNNLGVTLEEIGDLDAAHQAFKRALLLNPDCANAHYNLAELLEQLGKIREARKHWQAYLRLDSEGQSAKYARSRLKDLGDDGQKASR
jgi:tetratricopeptide (TPR) repeat protein